MHWLQPETWACWPWIYICNYAYAYNYLCIPWPYIYAVYICIIIPTDSVLRLLMSRGPPKPFENQLLQYFGFSGASCSGVVRCDLVESLVFWVCIHSFVCLDFQPQHMKHLLLLCILLTATVARASPTQVTNNRSTALFVQTAAGLPLETTVRHMSETELNPCLLTSYF